MFERFTQDARDVVVAAQRVASDGRWGEVRNEHLMLALLRRTDSAGVRALVAAGLTEAGRRDLEARFVALNRRAGVSDGDVEALREIGIDVEGVLDRLEEIAGQPEQEDRREPGRARDRGQGRTSMGRSPGFSNPAKYTLERALREAIHLRDKHIDGGHIVLALLSRPGVVTETLESHGVTYADVRRAISTGADAG